jgi:O-antigen ligase
VSISPRIGLKAPGVPEAAFIAVTAGLTAAAIVVPSLGLVFLVVAAVALILWIAVRFLHGNTEPLALLWVLIFPLGYYFASFPREKAVLTLDRAVITILVVSMGFAAPRYLSKVPRALSRSALAWLVFLIVAGVSLHKAAYPLTSARLIVDSFLLPALLGAYVIRFFRVRQHLAALHTFCCLMAVYVAAVGVVEFATGQDVLPLPGGELVFAGRWARPNGPFNSDDAFAIIGLLTFFFILFLGHALRDRWSGSRRLLHSIGMSCALASGLMPLFRSVLATLVIILTLDFFFAKKPSQRVALVGLLILLAGLVLGSAVFAPDAYSDRSRPDNLYFRIAGEKQFLSVFLDNPLFGVGIGNYSKAVSQESRYAALYQGVQSTEAPHSNLGAVLSETGLVGFIPYVLAQILLIAAFYKFKKSGDPEGIFVWKFFLYAFLSYWISGLTLASGYYSETNLFFIFVLAAIYKYGVTGVDASRPRDEDRLIQVEPRSFSFSSAGYREF